MQSDINNLTLARRTGKKVFYGQEVAVLLGYKGDNKYSNIVIKRLKDRGVIKCIKRGLYAFAHEEISNFEYSNVLYAPSYISLDSALNYYGMLPQVPLAVTAITVKRAKGVDREGVVFEYLHIAPSYYWGYENINNVLIANREKALIDKVYFESFRNAKIAFMDEISLDGVSLEKLKSYANGIKNKAFRRLMETVYVKF